MLYSSNKNIILFLFQYLFTSSLGQILFWTLKYYSNQIYLFFEKILIIWRRTFFRDSFEGRSISTCFGLVLEWLCIINIHKLSCLGLVHLEVNSSKCSKWKDEEKYECSEWMQDFLCSISLFQKMFLWGRGSSLMTLTWSYKID